MGGSAELEPISGSELLAPLDLTIGVTAAAVGVGIGVGRRVAAVTRPVAGPLAGLVLRPPVVAERYQPGTWVLLARRRGRARRERLVPEATALLDRLVPVVADALLRRIDLTDVVRRHVDLDDLVSDVDLDAAVGRVDLDAVVGRLDLDRIVRERVDLDGIVATVDLDAVAARIDLDAVIERIDLVGLAEDVIAEVDLPEIIRESTGSMASETVRGVRMQGITADEAVGRAVDRFRLRRNRRPPPVVPGTVGEP
jgi:hypothetical protein